MIAASAYILIIPANRREQLLDHAEFSSADSRVAEPVPKFAHSRMAPLVVLASFEDGKITHIADGKKGASAGTGLVRLNMSELEALPRPLEFTELEKGVSSRVRAHLRKKFAAGGLLPPKSLAALVARVLELSPSVASRLSRFSARRHQALQRLNESEKDNLALQKESLGLALELGGLPRDELLEWEPSYEGATKSFLDGLPGAQVREDVMLLADFSILPGFQQTDEVTHYGAKTFVSPDEPSVKLTVVMANRLPLEEQTGADLIYFNEAYSSFVMVQYKAMERGNNGAEFRWCDGDQLSEEIQRMDKLIDQLRGIQPGPSPDGFRFSENPFFLKFCPRVVFNPDDKGLFKGMYFPLDLWKMAVASGRLKGTKGGNLLTYENAGRRINNTEFVGLVAGSWVGTNIEQSETLGPLIREVLSTGKTVTLAVKHAVGGPTNV